MFINYSQSVMEQYRNIDNYNADKAGFEKVNDIANGLGIAMGAKQEIFTYAVALNYKTAKNNFAFARLREGQQTWRTMNISSRGRVVRVP